MLLLANYINWATIQKQDTNELLEQDQFVFNFSFHFLFQIIYYRIAVSVQNECRSYDFVKVDMDRVQKLF